VFSRSISPPVTWLASASPPRRIRCGRCCSAGSVFMHSATGGVSAMDHAGAVRPGHSSADATGCPRVDRTGPDERLLPRFSHPCRRRRRLGNPTRGSDVHPAAPPTARTAAPCRPITDARLGQSSGHGGRHRAHPAVPGTARLPPSRDSPPTKMLFRPASTPTALTVRATSWPTVSKAYWPACDQPCDGDRLYSRSTTP
jgi:hypothetical protein